MKTNMLKLKSIIVMLIVVLAACSKSSDPSLSTQQSQTVNNESTQDSQQDETDDISTNALGNTDSPTGREEAFSFTDARLSCAIVTHDTTGFKVKGQGTITIDFGTGCTDKAGNTRAGKIIVSWTGGRWFIPGSSYTITYSGYSINNVKFSDNDTRSVTNVSTTLSPLTFNVVATHTLTWPDGTTATRAVNKTRQWVRSTTITDDKFIVSQTSGSVPAAVGVNRHGVAYSMSITTPLEYDRSCAISSKVFKPVKGVKVITYDTNKTITVDFGTGTCDNTYTVTADGVTKTVNAKNDSSND